MPIDDPSAKDSVILGADLVAALGFEPVSTEPDDIGDIDTIDADDMSRNGSSTVDHDESAFVEESENDPEVAEAADAADAGTGGTTDVVGDPHEVDDDRVADDPVSDDHVADERVADEEFDTSDLIPASTDTDTTPDSQDPTMSAETDTDLDSTDLDESGGFAVVDDVQIIDDVDVIDDPAVEDTVEETSKGVSRGRFGVRGLFSRQAESVIDDQSSTGELFASEVARAASVDADLESEDLDGLDLRSNDEDSIPSEAEFYDYESELSDGAEDGVRPIDAIDAVDAVDDEVDAYQDHEVETPSSVEALLDLPATLPDEQPEAGEVEADDDEMVDPGSLVEEDPTTSLDLTDTEFDTDTDFGSDTHTESDFDSDTIDLDRTFAPDVMPGEIALSSPEIDLDLDAGGAIVASSGTALSPVGSSVSKKLRARKSRRVIRHIDPWSVLTFSILFHLAFFSAMLLAGVLVWNAAIAAGTVESIENFIRELADYETFEINSQQVFRAAVIIAGMLTLASSVLVVLLTVVFNLISDLVGGIRITVIEEETVRVQPEQK